MFEIPVDRLTVVVTLLTSPVPVPVPVADATNAVPMLLFAAPNKVKFVVPVAVITYPLFATSAFAASVVEKSVIDKLPVRLALVVLT